MSRRRHRIRRRSFSPLGSASAPWLKSFAARIARDAVSRYNFQQAHSLMLSGHHSLDGTQTRPLGGGRTKEKFHSKLPYEWTNFVGNPCLCPVAHGRQCLLSR